jgi:hypothetical protein
MDVPAARLRELDTDNLAIVPLVTSSQPLDDAANSVTAP